MEKCLQKMKDQTSERRLTIDIFIATLFVQPVVCRKVVLLFMV